jgi:aquaporin Z
MCWILIAFMVAIEAPISGTSLNPARSLGPALIYGSYQDLWLFFIAPCIGAIGGWGLFLLARREGVYLRTAKLYYTDKYRTVFHPDPSRPAPEPVPVTD